MKIKIKKSKLSQMIKNSVLQFLNKEDIRKNEQTKFKPRRFVEEKKQESEVKDALLEEENVKIINADGTSGDEPNNSKSWKEYWEKEKGVKLEDILPEKNGKFLCPGHEHHEEDDGYVEPEKICGCHVQKVDADGNIIDDTMYITPMCSGCNKRNDAFKVGKKALVKR